METVIRVQNVTQGYGWHFPVTHYQWKYAALRFVLIRDLYGVHPGKVFKKKCIHVQRVIESSRRGVGI